MWSADPTRRRACSEDHDCDQESGICTVGRCQRLNANQDSNSGVGVSRAPEWSGNIGGHESRKMPEVGEQLENIARGK